jgi:hypothetical protein
MESDRRLNRWGLTFTPTVANHLRKLAIYGQPQLSLEHQGHAKRYVVRGVESGGATVEVGYYVSFGAENGEVMPWLQTLDSLMVNGPHAVVIAPVVTRIEMLRISTTYELCITRHRPVVTEVGRRPQLRAEELFRGQHGYLALELWGKDKDLSGYVMPQFFTRSGEEIELPSGFADAVKAVTGGVTCLNCSHPHYSRLVVAPPSPARTKELKAFTGEDDTRSGDHRRLVEAEAMVVADGVPASRAVFIGPTVSDGKTGGES